MLDVVTIYWLGIPVDKLDEVIRGIREVFSLPNNAHPKWYLEPGIIEKDPDEYHLPSTSSISTIT